MRAFFIKTLGKMMVQVHPPKLPDPKRIEKDILKKGIKKPLSDIDKKPI